VDPELAARARASLPVPGDFRAYGRASAYRPRPPRIEPAPPVLDAPAAHGRRVARTVSVAAITFVLGLAAPIVWSLFRSPRATLASDAGGSGPAAAGLLRPASTGQAQRSRPGARPTAPRSSAGSSAQRAQRSRRQAAPAAHRPARPRASKHARSARRIAAPTLRWQAVFGARVYRVALHRLVGGGREREVLELTTHVPHVTLPVRWRRGRHRYHLVAGRYRWRLYVISAGPDRGGVAVASHELVLR
jgi:hypothetical protein